MNVTDEEVINVVKVACSDTFIYQLEHGYQTNYDGSSNHLSGGERQRIAIAKTMLKDASIIIFDEVSANIGPENEDKL